MQKCEYCGKEYIENTADLSYMPDFWREKMKYIPSCDCLEKIKEAEIKELERKQEEENRRNRVKKYKEISVIDSKFLKSKFENADMREKHMKIAERYAKSFLEKKQKIGMLLYGGVGTGKTYASACIANYLMEHGKTVLVINLGLYFNKLKIGWEAVEKEMLKGIVDCDLLIIDDFGAEKSSEKTDEKVSWRDEKIFNLIDARYRAEKPLIISTNFKFNEDSSQCEIENVLGSRIRDRIIDMCYPVAVLGRSKRGIGENEFWKSIA